MVDAEEEAGVGVEVGVALDKVEGLMATGEAVEKETMVTGMATGD